MLYYKPTVIGKENIPKDGPIIVVGNHKHIYDQCPIILSTKRGIKYMAKKEYFDDKKVAWFFKSVGCISVDRSKKDEKAVEAALEELKKVGQLVYSLKVHETKLMNFYYHLNLVQLVWLRKLMHI